jgi:integrase
MNEELAMIKRFYRWLQRRDYLYKNPVESIERFKHEPKEIRIFSRDEIRLILSHATPVHRPFYEMLLYTGLRDGELRNLEWADVDLRKGLIYVRVKEEWRPKTRRGRVVPLAGEAIALLRSLSKNGKYLFTTRSGKPWVPPRQPWVSLLDRIEKKEGVNLKGQVSLHTFRHTFATTCLMNGVDIKTVSEFLGHTTVRMTEKYLHLLPEHKMQAIQQVNFKVLTS